MGFMSETETIVGSSAYNLAGEPKDRGSFLKNNVISSIVSGSHSKYGMGECIIAAHLAGPRTDLIRYGKWAHKSGYAAKVGVPKGIFDTQPRMDLTTLEEVLAPIPENQEVTYLTGSAGGIDYKALGDWYVGNNYPHRVWQEYSVEPEVINNPFVGASYTNNLKVTFLVDGFNVTFASPVNLLDESSVIAYFYYQKRTIYPPTTTDSGWIAVDSPGEFPALPAGYVYSVSDSSSTANTLHPYQDVETDITYSDTTPPESSSATHYLTPVTKTDSISAYKRLVIEPGQGANGFSGSVEDQQTILRNTNWTLGEEIDVEEIVEVLVGGVIKTTTITTYTYSPVENYSYKNTSLKTLKENWGVIQCVPYKKGTSSSLDDLIFSTEGREENEYLPIIPVRKNNKPVDAVNYPTQYVLNRKAARKAFKKSKTYSDMLKNLEDNEDVKEIDHAWIVFGCSLGSTEQEQKRYIFQFLKDWVDAGPITGSVRDPVVFSTDVGAYWDALRDYQIFSTGSGDSWVNPSTRPPKPVLPEAATYRFRTYQSRTGVFGNEIPTVENEWAYNIDITAKGGKKDTGSGFHSKSGNKKGTCWIYKDGSISVRIDEPNGDANIGGVVTTYKNTAVIKVGCQLTNNSWEEYTFFDFVCKNMVYQGISVTTLAEKALEKGEDSGFILPIAIDTLKRTGLIKGTQFAMGASYLVINYYKKVKTPWYASGLFQFVVIVIIIVIAAYTGYLDPNSVGLLGANATVGVAIGLTGTAAIIAGAVMNALAAAILGAIIQKVSVALLGDQVGAIVGMVVTMVVMWGVQNNWQFDTNAVMQSMTKADMLLKLTEAGTKIGDYYQQQAAQITADTASLMEDYRDKVTELAAMTEQYLGNTGVDPLMITRAMRELAEKPEEFMARTLMTGDDIAHTTLSLVERFPEPQMKLPYT